MFVQSRIVYVIDENTGNENKIFKELNDIGLTEFFFKNNVSVDDKIFSKFLSSLPPGTVFCIDLDYQESEPIKKNYNIAIPFLSSHFKLPIKIGEVVWFYRYSLESKKQLKSKAFNIDGYYLGRVHSLNNTEDTSYCFFDRESTYFSLLRDDIFDLFHKQSNIGALEILDFNQNVNNYKDCIYNPDISFVSSYSKEFLNTPYFSKKIKSHGLKPQPNTKNYSTDVVLKGTYNSSIKLTKSSLNNVKETSQVQRGLDNFNSGKIELIAGENENKRRNSKKLTKLYSKIDKEGTILPEFLELCYYDEDICPEINNSLFFEKIKSISQFPNSILVENNIRNLTVKKYNQSLYSDLSKFIISELSIEDSIIKDTYIKSNKQLDYKAISQTKNSFLHEKSPLEKTFNTFYNIADLKGKSSPKEKKLSSIVGISDNISFFTHENTSGQITFLKPNATDNKSSFILINESGNINIEGNKILIGEYNRLSGKSHGGNALVFLGHSEEMQSLVLGEQLKVFLKETLDVQRESMDNIKDLFIKSKNVKAKINDNLSDVFTPNLSDFKKSANTNLGLIFNALSSAPIASAPMFNLNYAKTTEKAFEVYTETLEAFFNKSLKKLKQENKNAITEFESEISNSLLKRNEELSLRLKKIEDNIDLILSKFTKTS
jgi:hypothetical protein